MVDIQRAVCNNGDPERGCDSLWQAGAWSEWCHACVSLRAAHLKTITQAATRVTTAGTLHHQCV